MTINPPGSPPENPHRIKDAVESTAAKMVSSFVLPALISIIGFFLLTMLNDMRGSLAKVNTRQDQQADSLQGIRTDVSVINTRLDAYVIKQVDTNSARLNDHEKRLNTLERTVKTP